ncbi:MAG: class I SAM-dependent methyltransferase [Patescibacteria group bacterium]|nr:class I SAM-dependent methyltransferase [Patescibacteria group bacterium]MDD5294349.1 class I SAM-dependent methyltransferase [Patescibacteria group bacterium]MDD5554034.1 class I SAM-dependent methyltransferase [Patescibacteria group bacterium]
MIGKNSRNRWDKVYEDFKGKRFSVWKNGVTPFFADNIPFLKNRGVRKILDGGCGDGRNLLAFAKAGFETIGVDASEEACQRARRVAKKFPKIRIVNKNLEKINYNSEFDGIICDYVMVHLKRGPLVIRNFYRALKSKGFLLIEFLSKDDPSCVEYAECYTKNGIFHKFYDLEDVKELLTGFKIIRIKKIKHKDPSHVENYPRSKPHQHDSIFVLCQKE